MSQKVPNVAGIHGGAGKHDTEKGYIHSVSDRSDTVSRTVNQGRQVTVSGAEEMVGDDHKIESKVSEQDGQYLDPSSPRRSSYVPFARCLC